MKFTWPNPADDGYRRYRIYQGHHVTSGPQAAHFNGTLLTTRGSSVTSYTKSNLDCGNTYQFRSKSEGDGVTYTRTWSAYGNKAEVTATCGEEEEEPDPTPRPTSTSTATPVPYTFLIEYEDDARYHTFTARNKPTSVLDVVELRLTVSGGTAWFNVDTNFEQTGYQVDTGNKTCQWSYTDIEDVELLENVANSGKELFKVIRCGPGSGSNVGFTVSFRKQIWHDPVRVGDSGRLERAHYWSGTTISYKQSVASTFPNVLTTDTNYSNAASVWNGEGVGPSFTPTSGSADITFKAYDAATANHCRVGQSTKPDAIACITSGGYPEIQTGRTVWIKNPPTQRGKDPTVV